MQLGEVALNLQQQTCQRVGITLHLSKCLIVQLQQTVEVAQQRLAFEYEGVRVDTYKALLVLVILVVDLAYNLLQDVLQRHDTAGTSKLVDYDGYMYFVLLKFTQQVVDLLRLGYKVRWTNQRLPIELVTLRQVRQQVLDIQDTTDVILIVLIDGNTRIVVVNYAFQHVLIRCLEVQVDHILTTGHHLLHRLVAKAHDAFQHPLLLFDILGVRQLQSLLQLVYAQRLVLLLYHTLCQSS